MIRGLFSNARLEQMADAVRQVLAETGYRVEHPGVKELALKRGCHESPAGRVLFQDSQIDEIAAHLRRQYTTPNSAAPSPLTHALRPIRLGFGNMTPKYFNYATQRAEGGNTERLKELVKFAHAESRVGGIVLPLSRQDVPPEFEQMDSILLMAQLTDKPIGAVDVTVPGSIPYLAEMGVVLGRPPAEFVGSCNCINPPLRLEERTAEAMLARRAYHCRSMITSMPCLGGSGPVDICGAIILATAEIVGGLILATASDPDAPLMGYVASNQLDMRTGMGTSATPQTVRVDAGVCQLMADAFGGGTFVGGRSYVSARRPGLQATFERFLKAVGYATLADDQIPRYEANGNLDNGSMISPEQFLLDLDIFSGLEALWTAPTATAAGESAARIRDVTLNHNGNFLEMEHTLAHYRDEYWMSDCFLNAAKTAPEKAILDRCHERYRQTLNSYQPAAYPETVIRDLAAIVARARRDCGITTKLEETE